MKKLLSILLTLFLIASLFSFSAASVTMPEFDYEVTGNEVVITEYNGNAADVVIPNKLGIYAVTSIAANAFAYKTEIESVKLPDGLRTLAFGAFMGCSSLKTVYLPESVTNLDYAVFYECDSLNTVVYCGTSANRYTINILQGNDSLTDATWKYHLYSSGWSSNNNTHWHECEICHKTKSVAEHKDRNEDGICDICGVSFFVIYGDANGDGLINAKDLARLKKSLAGVTADIYRTADCDGSGSVDAKDLTRLKKYLAGIPVTLGISESEEEPTPSVIPESITWEEYCALSPEGKDAYLNSFSDINDFYAWMEAAKIAFKNEHPDIELGDDASIDFTNLP